MEKSGGVRFSPTVTLVLVVLALAAGALISRSVDGPVPGRLRVGVLALESPLRIERAVDPLASWLASSSRLAGEVVAPGTAGLDELSARCEVMLVPEAVARALPASRILAWARPVGVAAARDRLVLVEPDSGEGDGSCAVATEGLVDELADDCESVAVARSPFADRELLRAWVSGGYSAVLIRESVVDEAIRAGWFADRASRVTARSGDHGWVALVASAELDRGLRRRVREAALNLDKYRLDPSRQRVAAVLNALAELGIGGFVLPDSRGGFGY